MKTKELLFCLGMAFLLAGCSSKPRGEISNTEPEIAGMIVSSSAPLLSQKAVDLRVEMRKLWEDQITWTRNEIYCVVDGLPGGNQVLQHLLDHQANFGDLLEPYYGDSATTVIVGLLKDNVSITADVIKAVKEKNIKLLNSSNRTWFANADSIAVILSDENPNYGFGELKLMMHEHLRLMTQIADARVKKDYDSDVRAYDIAHDQVLKMSDVLSEGIVHHFPDRFR